MNFFVWLPTKATKGLSEHTPRTQFQQTADGSGKYLWGTHRFSELYVGMPRAAASVVVSRNGGLEATCNLFRRLQLGDQVGVIDGYLSGADEDCIDRCTDPNLRVPVIADCDDLNPCDFLSLLNEENQFGRAGLHGVADVVISATPRSWLIEQRLLWKAGLDYYALVFGTRKIGQTDPARSASYASFSPNSRLARPRNQPRACDSARKRERIC